MLLREIKNVKQVLIELNLTFHEEKVGGLGQLRIYELEVRLVCIVLNNMIEIFVEQAWMRA